MIRSKKFYHILAAPLGIGQLPAFHGLVVVLKNFLLNPAGLGYILKIQLDVADIDGHRAEIKKALHDIFTLIIQAEHVFQQGRTFGLSSQRLSIQIDDVFLGDLKAVIGPVCKDIEQDEEI